MSEYVSLAERMEQQGKKEYSFRKDGIGEPIEGLGRTVHEDEWPPKKKLHNGKPIGRDNNFFADLAKQE